MISDFLHEEAQKISTTANVNIFPSSCYQNKYKSKQPHTVLVQYPENKDAETKEKCKYCNKSEHALTKCKQFLKALRKDRWRHVKRYGLCFKCLLSRHGRETCSAPACDRDNCGGAHHKLLHNPPRRELNETTTEEQKPSTSTATASETVAHLSVTDKKVLLKVVPVNVHGPNGVISACALLDDGSTVSLISSQLAARAGLNGRAESLRVRGADALVCASTALTLDLSAKGSNNELLTINVRSVNNLDLPVQNVSLTECQQYAHLSNVKINCQDNYHLLMPLEICVGKNNEPSATRTPLGWCVHGILHVPRATPSSPYTTLFIMETASADDRALQALSEEVRRSFSIDALGVSGKPRQNKDEVRAVDLLENSAQLIDGRWHVGLPWKEPKCNVPKETLGDAAVRFKIDGQFQGERTLGMICIIKGKQRPNKRLMSAVIMSIFDIFGFLSPFTIQGKIMLQDIWKYNIDWDETIPDDVYKKWCNWIDLLKEIPNIRIPRDYVAAGASETEIVSTTSVRETDSAARVAPLKPITIPKLELQAALLAARLADTITREHELKINERYIWCDSTTVLQWIYNDTRHYKTFVANRLGEIDDLTRASKWRYVPTKLNIADIGTRETYDVTVFNNDWFVGPSFLHHDKSTWPRHDLLRIEAVNHATEWSFIPPVSPHWGGAWERLIRSIKTSLKVILKERAPKDEVLCTLLAEVENIVNSRPLSHVSVEPGSDKTLTPNHFLLGSSSNLPTPGRFDDSDLSLRKQWRKSQKLADVFWKRWVNEILPELVSRRKWNHEQRSLQVGDLVLIVDPGAPRNVWPKAVVQQVFPGVDGRVRMVEVTGTLKRSAARVARIPLVDEC
ncbi:hypothetical protein ABMA27_010307 [Loxostege sticticalis]|uniref:DUF5641 domain-containing protein n=1 Tax=Loxostege sticticalis TaxID=481309 RepID=A0ABR3H5C4_LOXSC